MLCSLIGFGSGRRRRLTLVQILFLSANSSTVPHSLTLFSPSEWTRIQFSTILICLFPSIVISRARPTFLIAPMFLISCSRRTFDYLLSVQWLRIGKLQVRGLANNRQQWGNGWTESALAWFIVWPHETCFAFTDRRWLLFLFHSISTRQEKIKEPTMTKKSETHFWIWMCTQEKNTFW